MGSVGKGDWKKVQQLLFCAGVTKLPASAPPEGGVFSPLTSKCSS